MANKTVLSVISIPASYLMFRITFDMIYGLCQAKVFPWSYCGEITGLMKVGLTSLIISLVLLVITNIIIWKRK